MHYLSWLINNLPNTYSHEQKAKKRLINSIDNEDLKQILNQGNFDKEHRIVVFGESAVGKTTLILKLLGAKSTQEDPNNNLTKIAKYLRGNIRLGGAGTATVYQYSVSPNNCASVTKPGTTPVIYNTLEELKQCLSEIRRSVENGEWVFNSPVKIRLPKKFFNPKAPKIPWTITDLPGVNSADINEHSHVHNLIKAHVYNSNVLLVIEKANKMGMIEDLEIKGFGSWKYFGRRARVIITFSASENSMKKELIKTIKQQSRSEIGSQFFRELWFKTLNDQGVEFDDPEKIFPLEYGDSWDKLLKQNPEVASSVANAMEDSKQALIDSLNKSLNKSEEFLALCDLMNYGQLIEKDIERLESKSAKTEAKGHRINKMVVQLESRLEEIPIEIDNNRIETNSKVSELLNKRWNNPWNSYNQETKHYTRDNYGEQDEFWNKKREEFRGLLKEHSKSFFGNEFELSNRLRLKVGDEYPPFQDHWRDWCESYKGWNKKKNYHAPFNKIFRKGHHAQWAHADAVRRGLECIINYWSKNISEIEDNYIKGVKEEADQVEKKMKFKDSVWQSRKVQLEKVLQENKKLLLESKSKVSELKELKDKELINLVSEKLPLYRAEAVRELKMSTESFIKNTENEFVQLQKLALLHKSITFTKSNICS